ncbi:MAG TPA: alkaline phosphatase family protein [Candidatus Angelobacter sp.]|nr:alkaline phosphatase family protein [Candidatus Angelobacter sp.]
MNALLKLSPAVGLLLLSACVSRSPTVVRHPPADLPGQRPDGSVLLPNQWSLRPVGRQIVLGDFPVNIAVHPGNRFIAVLHSGHGRHEIAVVDITAGKVIGEFAVDESFYGIEFSRDGRELFCSGAGDEVIHRFAFQDGYLAEPKAFKVRDATERGIPAGLALSADARKLFVANVWGQRISQVDLDGAAKVTDITLGSAGVSPAAPATATPADEDTAAATKRAQAAQEKISDDSPFPYACRLDEKRQRLYVSLWAKAAVAVIDLKTSQVIDRWPAQEHPCEMVLTSSGKVLFVANAARNSVTVLDTGSGKALETLTASLYPGLPPGSTPNSLALSPDEKTLFVANADNNNIAVFDVTTPGKSRSLGFIPAGWYPTSVRVTPDGKRLLVANGKGIIPKANPHGPQPMNEPPASVREYIGGLFRGTLSVIDLQPREKLEEQLASWTAQAYRCSPIKADLRAGGSPASGNPVPAKVGDPSPIKYCIYVIKENRTYDQVLGDMPEGNGDPALCLFGERITPNHHQLARDFVLLDNFYVESEVSADGHEWTMGAYATDFVEKFWPLSYGHNKHGKYPYPAEGNFSVARPAGGYLWDRAREAGVSYRSYGEFINNGKTSNDPGKSRVATLQDHFDESYRGFDLDYSDQKRADRFIAELKRFEKEGEMPRLQIVRLPNDHTHGTTIGKHTPFALVADNDLALGRFVEAVSRSKFWPQTAIFVVEDDAQNGPDHVDAHRTIAFVISPYTRRGAADSTMYSTSSMLRTMELILGLRPMSQYDAAAMPMFNSFHAKPDLRPYKTLAANVDLNERNTKLAWGSGLSKKMNFAKEDAADDLLLNEVIWRSVRGAHNPMPAPVRAAFVFAHEKDGDDDD